MRGKSLDEVTLREAAASLGVHYMTAYRYVRTGRLPATSVGGEWRIRRADLDDLTRPRARPRTPAGGIGATRRRLLDRLVAGDEAGGWRLIDDAVVGGLEPVAVHIELLAPVLRAIGAGWADGSLSVDEEHRAAAVSHRLIGRLGPRFVRPGRKRGSVVLAGAPGDTHALPTAIAADVVRAARFAVTDLGAAVPPEFLARAAAATDRLVAVGICVSVSGKEEAVASSIAAVREAAPDAAVLLGGSAMGDTEAGRLGADGYAEDAVGLVGLLEDRRG